MYVWTLVLIALSGAPPMPQTVSEATVGPYVLVVRPDSLGTRDVFEVTRNGEEVFAVTDYLRIAIGTPLETDIPALEPGVDVSGDGIPDAVIHGWNGGAHCCFTSWVLSLGNEFRILAEVDGGHSEALFEDVDGDHAIEVLVRDWSFAYFPGSFGASPAPSVVLDWVGGRLEPSPVLTGFPRPDERELAAEAAEMAESPRWGGQMAGWPYTEVFGRLLELLYGGYDDLAWPYLEHAWGGDPVTKTKWVAELGRRLERSPYYGELESARRYRQ